MLLPEKCSAGVTIPGEAALSAVFSPQCSLRSLLSAAFYPLSSLRCLLYLRTSLRSEQAQAPAEFSPEPDKREASPLEE